MTQIEIFPTPARVHSQGGRFPLPARLDVMADGRITHVFNQRKITWAELLAPFSGVGTAPSLPLHVRLDEDLGPEAYRLKTGLTGIDLCCGGAAGAFYGLSTLRQVYGQLKTGMLPCLQIEDAPALPVRGVLLDVGRGKIPTVETLTLLLDRLSGMKINHVQLYMDGYCFAWQPYAYLFSDETPLTAAEIQQLVQHAAARFIDLVPCLNSLGHMEQWLEKPQFRPYAECEDGFDFQGLYHRQPGTTNPQDKAAVAWVQGLFDELLANFDAGWSNWVNVNLDEPFELGKGKNAALAAQKGAHAPYLLMVEQMHRYCQKRGLRMMMWGDVLLASPESIPQIPKDVTVLHWMYEGDGRFEPAAQALARQGVDFLLCPGTSAWCSFTGRSDRMRRNVEDAVDCALRYGGRGVLLTDWGDLGHWQYLSASYVPFAFGAGLSWAGQRQSAQGVFRYCDAALFGDATGRAARLFYDLGNYYQFEHAPLFSTTLCAGVMTARHRFDGPDDFAAAMELLLSLSRHLAAGMGIPITHPDIRLDAEGLRAFMAGLLAEVETLELTAPDGAQTKAEALNAGRFVLHGLCLYTTMAGGPGQPAFRAGMAGLFQDMDALLRQHYRLWCGRNRTGGFAKSTAQLLHLMRVYQNSMA